MKERRVGNTVFLVTTERSEYATESLEKKLKKLMIQAAERDAKSYQSVQKSPPQPA